MANSTVHLKPWRSARILASCGSASSERYSSSPLTSTMCFPLPGPSCPSKTIHGSSALPDEHNDDQSQRRESGVRANGECDTAGYPGDGGQGSGNNSLPSGSKITARAAECQMFASPGSASPVLSKNLGELPLQRQHPEPDGGVEVSIARRWRISRSRYCRPRSSSSRSATR